MKRLTIAIIALALSATVQAGEVCHDGHRAGEARHCHEKERPGDVWVVAGAGILVTAAVVAYVQWRKGELHTLSRYGVPAPKASPHKVGMQFALNESGTQTARVFWRMKF